MEKTEPNALAFFRILAVFTLPLTCFWVLAQASGLVLSGLTNSPFSGCLPHVAMTAVYLIVAIAIQRSARLASVARLLPLSALLVPLGALAIAVGGSTGTALPAVLGIILYAAGMCLVSMAAYVSLSDEDTMQCLIALSFSGVAAMFASGLLSSVSIQITLAIAAACSVVTYLLSANRAKRLLETYRGAPSLSSLSLTNPLSFLPFTSQLFVCVFVLMAVNSFCTSVSGSLQSATSAFYVMLVPMLVLLFFGLFRGGKPANHLYNGAAVFTAMAIVCELAFPDAARTVISVSANCSISLCDILIAWYTVFSLGPRNSLLVLPALAIGRLACDLGLCVGSIARTTVFVYNPEALTLVAAAFALAFFVYNLVGLKKFDLDDLSAEIYEATPVEVEEEVEPQAGSLPEPALDPTLEGRLMGEYHLTAREIEIYKYLAHGRNGKYISDKLVVSPNTIKTHARNIYAKLEVHSQQELIDFGDRLQQGL